MNIIQITFICTDSKRKTDELIMKQADQLKLFICPDWYIFSVQSCHLGTLLLLSVSFGRISIQKVRIFSTFNLKKPRQNGKKSSNLTVYPFLWYKFVKQTDKSVELASLKCPNTTKYRKL